MKIFKLPSIYTGNAYTVLFYNGFNHIIKNSKEIYKIANEKSFCENYAYQDLTIFNECDVAEDSYSYLYNKDKLITKKKTDECRLELVKENFYCTVNSNESKTTNILVTTVGETYGVNEEMGVTLYKDSKVSKNLENKTLTNMMSYGGVYTYISVEGKEKLIRGIIDSEGKQIVKNIFKCWFI